MIAKLTPNVTTSRRSRGRRRAGADAVSLVNTFVGMAIDWRKRKPILGNITGGLSGPAIKPLALRLVWQVARNVRIPIIGIGGITTIDDVMDFLVAGAMPSRSAPPTSSTRCCGHWVLAVVRAAADMGAGTASAARAELVSARWTPRSVRRTRGSAPAVRSTSRAAPGRWGSPRRSAAPSAA